MSAAYNEADRHIEHARTPPADQRELSAHGRTSKPVALYWLLAIAVAGVITWMILMKVAGSGGPLLTDDFNQPNGLITNEFAHFNPANPAAVRSPVWIVTSGSLFARDHAGWTGVPDRGIPGPRSAHANDSLVFRAVTRRDDFLDVSVAFRLLVQRWADQRSAPSYQGVHVFLRYQSPNLLYVVSVDRRDGVIVIKKKVPGGPADAGVYYTLASKQEKQVIGRWEAVRASVVNNGEGGVDLRLWLNGKQMLSAVDNGVGDVPPITRAGRVGLRGDYTQFAFDDFVVKPATASS